MRRYLFAAHSRSRPLVEALLARFYRRSDHVLVPTNELAVKMRALRCVRPLTWAFPVKRLIKTNPAQFCFGASLSFLAITRLYAARYVSSGFLDGQPAFDRALLTSPHALIIATILSAVATIPLPPILALNSSAPGQARR